MTASFINLPAFSASTLVAILLANAVLLFALFVLAGPALVSGRDLLGRPGMALARRVMVAVAILGVAVYFAVEAVQLWTFWPYYLDPGATAVETVVAKAAVPPERPVVWWIGTETHRYGVTREIYTQVAVGDTIEARFRAVDDTLYELSVLPKGSRP